MSQFRAFCAAAVSAKQLEYAARIQHVAIGAQGTEKGIKAAVKSTLDG